MFFRTLLAASALALGTFTAQAGDYATNSGYALANDGKTLLVMRDLTRPTDIQSYEMENAVSAIAWRPVTGELLGFANGAIHSIDAASGKMTNLDAKFMADAATADGAAVGFDFNNKIDAVRVVSTAGDNLVYFPKGFGNGNEKAESVRRFTTLHYAEGDVNAGRVPAIFANAYTNAINGKKAGSTAQFALDSETDSLVSLANNKGTLGTVGKITVAGKPMDIAAIGGFDITSKKEGKDAAYAILQAEGADTAGLYSINLSTGAATEITSLPVGGVSGFAVSRSQVIGTN